MIGNDIYCCINGFLKRNISKKTRYIVENKNLSGKICIVKLCDNAIQKNRKTN